jgi:ribosomal RNA assembly protein
MQEVYISLNRAEQLRKLDKELKRIEKICNCKIDIKSGNVVEFDGDAYGEFTAKNIIYAFGRGFDMKIAEKLLSDDVYFSSLNITDYTKSIDRRTEIRARLIGNEGRAKKYMEDVSGAYISVYGDTISFIGSFESINEAETAAKTLLGGGSHKLAYIRMEAAHKKYKGQTKGGDLLNE